MITNKPFFTRKLVHISIAVFALLFLNHTALAIDYSKHAKLSAIVEELVNEGLYSRSELGEIFTAAEFKQPILDAMSKPAEYRFTWGKYRKLFLQEDRISQGVDFWNSHKATFDRAEREYGVPASMIAAIIGVESKFGKFRGSHKVLDSLVTLVVGYERRSKFFANELKHFLILSKENQLDATKVMGSYAGAMGFPQFISSSYRNWAIDFSGDGVTDLINQPEDAIGSVANYFVENGWLEGQPVTSRPHENVSKALVDLSNRKRKVQFRASELRAMGAVLAENIEDHEKLNVLELNASEIVPNSDQKNSYIVRAGDTACEIAEAHVVPCRALFKLNKLDKSGSIYRGQVLKIPTEKRVDDKTVQLTKKGESKGVSKSASLNKINSSDPASKWVVTTKSSVAAPENALDKKVSSSNLKTPKSNSQNEGQEQLRYFYTHENFYVITRYNQSVLYAMAVNELSREIAKAAQSSQ